jgi:RNA polymerase sigma-70 factor (ECF subfamily)
MHNLYVNQLRERGRDVALEELPDATGADSPHGRMRDIEQALGLLQPDQREILLMVTLEGLSYREVATVLGIPEGTVMSRLGRARERLRRVLDGEGSAELRRVK